MIEKRIAAFTLVELLVVIAIIGVMVAMAIPAVQASRELGRRAICQANLGQILLAVQNYENAFEALPPGVVNPDGPVKSGPAGLHQGWMIHMLVYLDEVPAYKLIDFSKSVYDPANARVRELSPPAFICPSEPRDDRGKSNYAGCHHDVEAPIAADNHGVLYLNSHLRLADISDGASHTIFVAEKRLDEEDRGWMSGTRATLRNTGLVPNTFVAITMASKIDRAPRPAEGAAADAGAANSTALYVGGFSSAHVHGVFVGYGDASVRYTTDEIDLTLWQRLGNRADGSPVDIKVESE